MKTVLYAVDDLRLSQAALAYRLAEEHLDLPLGMTLLLSVPEDSCELVEQAAHRQGITMTRVGGTDVSDTGVGAEDVPRLPPPTPA